MVGAVMLLDPDRLLGTATRARLVQEHDLVVLSDELELLHRQGGAGSLALLATSSPEELCARLTTLGVRCLVLAREPDGPQLLSLLSAGAVGYALVQDGGDDMLWSALSSVLAGHSYIPPAMLGGLLHELIQVDRPPPLPSDDPRFARLSRRERQVLELLAAGNDQQGIARALVISPQTARTHIQNVLGKLDVRSRLEAVALAHAHHQLGQTSGGA